jgi:hypothetical protein
MRDRYWYTDLIEAQNSTIIPREDNIINLTQNASTSQEHSESGRAVSGDGSSSHYRKAQALLQSRKR